MPTTIPIRCRIAACREALDDGNEWSFYLINDDEVGIDLAVLESVAYEWGGFGNSEAANVQVADLAPGTNALIWRDDGSGAELQMDFVLLVRVGNDESRLRFEFPKLYRKVDLPIVAGLGKPGFQVTPT